MRVFAFQGLLKVMCLLPQSEAPSSAEVHDSLYTLPLAPLLLLLYWGEPPLSNFWLRACIV